MVNLMLERDTGKHNKVETTFKTTFRMIETMLDRVKKYLMTNRTEYKLINFEKRRNGMDPNGL